MNLPANAYRKYGNRLVQVDGITFHSQKEANRYGELKLLEAAGSIKGLALQPRFPMIVNGFKVCDYVADFEYFEILWKHRAATVSSSAITLGSYTSTTRVVEDVKGVRTPAYRLKKKLMFACYGITVRET